MSIRPRLSPARRLLALGYLLVARIGLWAAERQVARAAEHGTHDERVQAFDLWAEMCLHVGRCERAVRR